MTLMPVACLLVSLTPACSAAAQAPVVRAEGARVTAIRCGALIDGRRDEPLVDAVLVIEGERIVSVREHGEVPDGVSEVIDLRAHTVLPGLIDAHAHPLIAKDDYQIDHLRLSSASKALRTPRCIDQPGGPSPCDTGPSNWPWAYR